MSAVKVIGLVLLAAYLILSGISSLSGMTAPVIATDIIELLAIGAGILILISMKKFMGEK